MDTISKKYIWIFFSILITAMLVAYIINTIYAPERKPAQPLDNTTGTASYVTVRDTSGNIILETGIPIYVDDEYINEKNIHYIIISIEEDGNAIARVKNSSSSESDKQVTGSAAIAYNSAIPVQAVLKPRHTVIYHTHTDESYTPTSGTASKPGNGDVYQVGATLKESLNRAGISVTHSLNKHDPHDINAYHRSRRTVVQLLKERPDAAFDIHRDSAPRDAYATSINGIDSARVMIVVGRSNPNVKTNLAYAKTIKAIADELHPGLMRGIFMGKGDYNQDLYPTALIFEVGTESISLDMAEKAARYLADVIITTFKRQ